MNLITICTHLYIHYNRESTQIPTPVELNGRHQLVRDEVPGAVTCQSQPEPRWVRGGSPAGSKDFSKWNNWFVNWEDTRGGHLPVYIRLSMLHAGLLSSLRPYDLFNMTMVFCSEIFCVFLVCILPQVDISVPFLWWWENLPDPRDSWRVTLSLYRLNWYCWDLCIGIVDYSILRTCRIWEGSELSWKVFYILHILFGSLLHIFHSYRI